MKFIENQDYVSVRMENGETYKGETWDITVRLVPDSDKGLRYLIGLDGFWPEGNRYGGDKLTINPVDGTQVPAKVEKDPYRGLDIKPDLSDHPIEDDHFPSLINSTYLDPLFWSHDQAEELGNIISSERKPITTLKHKVSWPFILQYTRTTMPTGVEIYPHQKGGWGRRLRDKTQLVLVDRIPIVGVRQETTSSCHHSDGYRGPSTATWHTTKISVYLDAKRRWFKQNGTRISTDD